VITMDMIGKVKRLHFRDPYPQPGIKIPAFAPGQISVGTGDQNSIGADRHCGHYRNPPHPFRPHRQRYSLVVNDGDM